jgi:DNA-binding winged helix-turn-helix (wHTH) protein
MLELFRANPQKVLYHDELLAHAFGPDFVGDIALLHDEIRRLRRALGVRARSEGPIRTVKGVGYLFDTAVREASPRRPSAAPARKATSGASS